MKLIILLLMFSYYSFYPQSEPDTVYKFGIRGTASSLLSFFEKERYPGSEKNMVFGTGFFIRCMWHPARLLSIGIMSGFCQIAEDEFKTDNGQFAAAKLSSIPLQLVVSMISKKSEFGIGMGPYLMLSEIDYGSQASGSRLELGITFLGSYRFQLNQNLFIGPELRVIYLSYRGILSINPSVFIQFDILRY